MVQTHTEFIKHRITGVSGANALKEPQRATATAGRGVSLLSASEGDLQQLHADRPHSGCCSAEKQRMSYGP